MIRLLASTSEYHEFVRATFPERRGSASVGALDDEGEQYPRFQSSFLSPDVGAPNDRTLTRSAITAAPPPRAGGKPNASAMDGSRMYEFNGRGGGDVRPKSLGPGHGMPHPDSMQAYGKDTSGQALDASMESAHWIPAEAVTVTANFRKNHLPHVPPNLIRTLCCRSARCLFVVAALLVAV